MIKINKKTIYIVSSLLFVVVIYFLSTRSKLNNPLLTEPIIPEQTKVDPENLNPNKIIVAQNLTPAQNGNYAIINKQLTLNKNNEIQVIETNKEDVVDFSVNQNSITITTGDVYGENKKYYLYNISDKKLETLSTSKTGLIVSTSGSPDGTKAALLSNYNSTTDTSNFYIFDYKSKQLALVYSNIKKNKTLFVDNNHILLISEKHKSEPNTNMDIYSLTKSSIIKSNIETGENKYCYTEPNLFFYNHSSNLMNSFNTASGTLGVFNNSALQISEKIYCTSNSFYIVSNENQQLSIRTLDNNFNQVQAKSFKTNDSNIYIQSFIQENKLINKFYDRQKDSYFFLSYP